MRFAVKFHSSAPTTALYARQTTGARTTVTVGWDTRKLKLMSPASTR